MSWEADRELNLTDETPLVATGPDVPVTAEVLDEPLPVYLDGTRQRIRNHMADLLASVPSDSPFRKLFRHTLAGAASYTRPALVYVTGDTFGTPREDLDAFALMSESIHAASLLVDDWQDGSDTRRGQPAAHVRFGPKETVNGALALALDAVGSAAVIEAEAGLEAGHLSGYVKRAVGSEGMCMGQALDLAMFGRDPATVPVEELDFVARKKTGLAIEMSIVGAAMLGRLSPERIAHLENYSHHLGLAYQVNDDLRDATAGDGQRAKTPHADFRNRRPNYVSVLGAAAAEAKLQAHTEMAEEAIDHLAPDANVVKFRQILAHVAR